MVHVLFRPRALAASLLAACLGSASAFEAWEHERMGNLAFHLARRLHCEGAPAAQAPAAQAARQAQCNALDVMFKDPLDERPILNPATFGYGTVVRCVDFFLTPEKMLAGHDDRLIFSHEDGQQRSAGGSRAAIPTSAAHFLGIDMHRHCADGWINLSATQAAHSNHTHFQAEMVAAQHLYHRLAIDASRQGQDFGALLLNGISDHYLQDFFAPGHIVTFRSHMSDIYANAMHDSVNHKGAWLRFERQSLQDLLDGVRDAARQVPLTQRVRNYLARVEDGPRRPDKGACLRRCEDLGSAQWQQLDAATDVAALFDLVLGLATVDQRLGLRDHALLLRGDGELWRASQWPQRLLLLIMDVRSILDVLQAHQAAGSVSNSYDRPIWKSERQRDHERANIVASLDGRFAYDFMLLGRNEFPWLPYTKRARIADVDDRHDVLEIAGLEGSRLWLRPEGRREFVISAGLNYEVPRFGRQQWRESLSVETPVVGFVNSGFAKTSFGLAAGYFRTHEGGRMGYGLSLRPAVVFSQSETFVSLPMRWFHYSRSDGSSSTRPAWGLRIDQGFSSFITVYLQGGRAPFMQDNDVIRSGSAFGAGIVLAAPFCRVPLLGRMCYL